MLVAASCFFVVAFVLFTLGATRASRAGASAQLVRRLLFAAGATSALAGALFAYAAS